MQKCLLTKLLNSVWEIGQKNCFSFTDTYLNQFSTDSLPFRITCVDWWGKNKFLLKTKTGAYLQNMQRENFKQVLLQNCSNVNTAEWQNIPSLLQIWVLPPDFLEAIHFQGVDYKMAYNAETETKKFANLLYFQLLRQYFWELMLPLAAKPQPAIKQPESYSNWIHDHFSFSSFFVLLFQKL